MMRQSQIPLGRKVIYACVLLSFALLAYTLVNPQLGLWELDTLSLRQRLVSEDRSRVSPIAIVAVDAKSRATPEMNTLFGRQPWRRDVYALASSFLKRGNARRVLFDISFDGGEDIVYRQADQRFAQSLEEDRFASSLLFTFNSDNGTPWEKLSPDAQAMLRRNAVTVTGAEHFPVIGDCRATGLNPPLKTLYPVMDFYSPACLIGDRSGVYRFWIPVTFYGDLAIPNSALGITMADNTPVAISANGLLQAGDRQVNLGDGLPLIRWYGNQLAEKNPPYPQYSLWDLVQSELVLSCKEKPSSYCTQIPLPDKPVLAPETFKDRYVIIGDTSPNSFDSHQVIYDAQRYPGVYVVANVLDNVLHDDFVRPAPQWFELLVGLALCAAVLWMVFSLESINVALMGSTVLIIGYFLVTIAAYVYGNTWITTVYPIAGMGVCFSGGYVYRYLRAKKDREQLRFAFGKYVSPSVMKQIEHDPNALKLGGTRQEMTMLFCDIRGFTTYSENHSPEEVQTFLTQYFSMMNDIILNRFNGTINKLIGDAIFAYWGFPLKTEEHALLAVSAALAMQAAIKEWQNDPSKPQVDIGIGVHTGEVMVGNVGSEDFMDFTLIGDAVNTASRLESLNKEMKTRIIVSGITYDRIADIIRARPLGSTKIRGKETEVPIYEPLGLNS